MSCIFWYGVFLTVKYILQEIKKLIVEGIEDVHVDPHLESTCTRDIRTFCGEVPKKSGHGDYDRISFLFVVVLELSTC